MEWLLWVIIGILVFVVLILSFKILIMRKSIKEIQTGFAEKLTTDTNTLIDISSRDKSIRNLASSVNTQLRSLRAEHLRFQQGDTELKNAVTNISHDLRTPLTAIFGYLDLLEQEDKSEETCRYINIIRNRAEILKQLTEELFKYSVIVSAEDDLKTEPVVINNVLEESIAAFYTALRKHGIIPNISITDDEIIRNVDRAALSRVFSNLINNAIKYSDGDLDIVLWANGEITFSNTASGLNKVQVGKLFDRFYTVEAARNSTGLGLTIARTLIEQMNGTISVKYENNRLIISILFPIK